MLAAVVMVPMSSIQKAARMLKTQIATTRALCMGHRPPAPNVSGAIALMLEANPQLTMRDVKHILAKTSRQVDAAIAPVVVDGITYHEWVTNAAGYTYHNYYGFGGIDVAAAVDAAKGFTSGSLGERSTADWISSGTIDQDVGFGATVDQAINVPTSGIVEYVLVRLTMTHEDPSEVGFRLTSPSETTTSIWQPYVAAATSVTVQGGLSVRQCILR
jgi:hypothetical protein